MKLDPNTDPETVKRASNYTFQMNGIVRRPPPTSPERKKLYEQIEEAEREAAQACRRHEAKRQELARQLLSNQSSMFPAAQTSLFEIPPADPNAAKAILAPFRAEVERTHTVVQLLYLKLKESLNETQTLF